MQFPPRSVAAFRAAAEIHAFLALEAALFALIDDPGGAFGGRGRLEGDALLALPLAALLAAGTAWLSARRENLAAGRAGILAVQGVFLVLFFLALGRDPFGATAAIAATLAFPPFLAALAPLVRFRHPLDGAVMRCGVTVALLGIGVSGYRVFQNPEAVAAALLLALPALLLSLAHEIAAVGFTPRGGPYAEWLLLVAALAVACGYGPLSEAFLLAVALRQAVVALRLLARSDFGRTVAAALYRRPAALFILSFAILILGGTTLLTFHAASARPEGVAFIDALFTATSAVCVTGLITLDTPNDFTLFGQVVILLLFQAGGLGVMTLSTFGTLLLTGRLGMTEETALESMVAADRPRALYRLLRFIVVSTLAIEAAGALLLFAFDDGPGGVAARAWRALFHGVSAFCNAGFSLHSDSLVGHARNLPYLATIGALITAGGIGFAALAVAGDRILGRRARASLGVRIALAVSAALLVAGTVAYAAFEWDRTLAGLTPAQKIGNALFQSATTRTAGFNSVDYGAMAPPTLLLFLALMFVGASPGSTGGGIKTTTAMLILLSVVAAARRRDTVEFGGRTVPPFTVAKAGGLAAVSLLAVLLVAGLLLATQSGRFDHLLFECFSAFGTVGLSLGVTPRLDDIGKILIMVLMFTGRVGPLTLALLFGAEEGARVRLPREDVMVG